LDEQKDDFIVALQNSGMVMEFVRVDREPSPMEP
jgi:hypothetical protein